MNTDFTKDFIIIGLGILALVILLILLIYRDEKNQWKIHEMKSMIDKLEKEKDDNNEENSIVEEDSLTPKNIHKHFMLFGECPNCNKIVSNRDKFCDECGQKLNWKQSEVER